MNSSLRVWRVDLRLKPSRFFLCLIPSLHLAAIAALMQTGFPWYWLLPVVLWLLLSCARSLRQERNAAGIVLREQANSWWLETSQRQAQASLQHARVWSYLVVMDFLCRDEGKSWRQRVVIFPDSVSADGFRRLRVRLRYGPCLQQTDFL